MNYNINHWDSIITSDLILEEYHKNKSLIIDYLQHNPQELINHMWHDLLTIDNTCRVKINKGDLDSEFICIHCKNMQLLILDNPIGEPFKILTGSLTDQSMIITENKINLPHLQWMHKNLIRCDQFTMKILTTWYIENLFTKLKIPTIILYCAYICNNTGFLLYNIPTINNELCTLDQLFNVLDEHELIDIIDSLLLQILIIFDILKNNNVSLGHCDRMSFLVNNNSCEYSYQFNNITVDIKCPYTIYLSNLSSSHLKINNIEYTSKLSNQLMIDKFVNKLYQTKNNTFKIHNYDFNLKHKYPLSIDFYLFLSSFLEDPYIYHIIKSNEKAFTIWKKLWPDYDNTILKLTERYESEEINQDILNTWLYINPIQEL